MAIHQSIFIEVIVFIAEIITVGEIISLKINKKFSPDALKLLRSLSLTQNLIVVRTKTSCLNKIIHLKSIFTAFRIATSMKLQIETK